MNHERVEIGPCTLYSGDCLELLAEGHLKADALISDPPYGISFTHGANNATPFMDAQGKSKPIHGDDEPFDPTPWVKHIGQGPIMLFGADHYKTRLPDGGRFVVWDKSCGMGAAASFTDAEFAWTNRKNPRCVYRQFWMGATRSGEGASSRYKRQHPTEKPVELMAWCLDHARVGMGKIVLDPYMGSGTTGVACLRTGRKFVGCEIDDHYFEVARARIQAAWDAAQGEEA